MTKYTNALYPDKINDLVGNDGSLTEAGAEMVKEVVGPGQQGATGPMGPQGPQGPQGEIGPQGQQGPQGPVGPQGEGFSIFRTYRSIAEMTEDVDNVPEGKFVMITSDVEDPDNAKLYVRGSLYFTFVTDMSGSQGIEGPQGPQGIQGPQGEQGPQGIQGVEGPQGATGPKGDQGATGPQGEQGATGPAAVLPEFKTINSESLIGSGDISLPTMLDVNDAIALAITGAINTGYQEIQLMARSENNLTAVFADTATAIRAKKGTVDLIEPRDFADEVASIPTGIEPSGTLNIVNSEDNIDVTDYAAVNVRIPYAVGKDDGNYSSNLSSKVFGIDGNYSYINDPWIEDDTFYCTLGSAGMDAMYISQDSGDIQLDVDED